MSATNTTDQQRPAEPAALAVALLVGVPGLFYLMSVMLRNSMAVVEVELERAFALSATEAGVLLAASGALIDLFADAPGEHPPESFKAMFALLAGVNLFTTLVYGIATIRRSVTR